MKDMTSSGVSQLQKEQRQAADNLDERVSVSTELDSVIKEILFTERSYVADLTSLVMADLDHDCPLRAPLLRLQKLHTELLAALESAAGQLGPLCQAFLDCDFRVYAEYCASFPGALEWLRQVRADAASPRMQRHQRNQHQRKALLTLHLRLPLEAHLLQPVQRIARYPMLLRRLAAAADGAAARPAAARAAARMTEAAAETDERQRRQQQAERLLRAAVASSDDGRTAARWPGPLLLEASFSVRGHQTPRRALLFGRALLLTKCRNADSDGDMSLRAVFWCDRLALMDWLPREPLGFRLLGLDRPPSEAADAILLADSSAQKRLWCTELRRLIMDAIGGGGFGCGSFDPRDETSTVSENSAALVFPGSRRRNAAPRRSRSDAGSLRRRPGRPFEPCLAAYAQRLRVQDCVSETDVQPLLTALWGVEASLASSSGGGNCEGGSGGGFKRRGSLSAASSLVGSLLRRHGSGCSSLASSPRTSRRRAAATAAAAAAEDKSETLTSLKPATDGATEVSEPPVQLRASSRQPKTVRDGLARLIDSLPYADAEERARLSMAAVAVAAADVADAAQSDEFDVKDWRSTKDWSVENVFWKRALLDPPPQKESAVAADSSKRSANTIETQL